MTTYSSTVQDADYGCGGVATFRTDFTLQPTGFQRSEDDPSVALVSFSNAEKLTATKAYSPEKDIRLSSWLVYTTSVEELGSFSKQTIPPWDCYGDINSTSFNKAVKIKSDTFVKFGARWSGFESNPDGSPWPDLEWFNYELDNNYTITPPQNLQVTFPSTPDGAIAASIDSWSLNPNITGTVQGDGNPWNWRVELLNMSGDVVSTKEFNNNVLSTTLSADTSAVMPNQSYRLRVTACNAFQATTAISSEVIQSLPPTPIIQRVFFTKEGNGYNAHIDWAKPRSGGEYREIVRLNIPGYVSNQDLVWIDDGNSYTAPYVVENLPPATEITITLSNTTVAGSSEVTETFYTPSNVPTIGAQWDDDRRCVVVIPSAPNISNFDITLGYFQGDDSLANVSGSQARVCDLNHGGGQILYASATPKIPNKITYEDKTAFATIPILNPILGVSKSCTDTVNVVDIVESKSGILTPRWQNGDRVVKVDMCPRGSLLGNYSPEGEPCTGQYGNCLSHYRFENGVFYIEEGQIQEGEGGTTWIYTNPMPCSVTPEVLSLGAVRNWKIDVSPANWMMDGNNGDPRVTRIAGGFWLLDKDGNNLIYNDHQPFGPAYIYGYENTFYRGTVDVTKIAFVKFGFNLSFRTLVTTPVSFRLTLY